ncbi:hypothetical protein XIS1_1150033 [Xenorhabdus innexi]|uniref:Uncharacterized protein n=1 Tax=Xenorhabdus innexi TaxID=290109 RepID=A0A1N6MRF2_9GAMM|nr:hypothetical protein XIS1_1150033 [Xenorhabdus innexi]
MKIILLYNVGHYSDQHFFIAHNFNYIGWHFSVLRLKAHNEKKEYGHDGHNSYRILFTDSWVFTA